MKIVTEVLIFLFAAFLDLIRADRFPYGFRENHIEVIMKDEVSTLEASIEDRRNHYPQRMIWMYLDRGRLRQPEGYMAYIELPEYHHYGSRGELQKVPGAYFADRTQMPGRAFLRFNGNERYEAIDFQRYTPRKSTDPHLPVGDYGRIYIGYPQLSFFTALLQPAVYIPTPPRYVSPPRSPLPTTSLSRTRQRGCCAFLPGQRK